MGLSGDSVRQQRVPFAHIHDHLVIIFYFLLIKTYDNVIPIHNRWGFPSAWEPALRNRSQTRIGRYLQLVVVQYRACVCGTRLRIQVDLAQLLAECFYLYRVEAAAAVKPF